MVAPPRSVLKFSSISESGLLPFGGKSVILRNDNPYPPAQPPRGAASKNGSSNMHCKNLLKPFTAMLLGVWLTSLPASAQSHRYRLVWEDDFNGTAVDTASWSKIPRKATDWARHMSDEDSLYVLRDGCISLRGTVNGTVEGDTARYITAGLYTKGKRTVRYGKVEVRARMGSAQGAWPAIWMLCENNVWPRTGEIDLMEHLSHDSIVYQTTHSYYTHVLRVKDNPPHFTTVPVDAGEFNTYGVEILPDSLVYSVNGRTTLVYPRIATELEGQYPFGTPFYLHIDMQIEGSWVGRARPEELPVSMDVDWVRMYELVP